MVDENRNVICILDRLGYCEIYPRDANHWKPLEADDNNFGTTNQTRIKRPGAGDKYTELVDIASGERVAIVRKKCQR